MQNLFDSFQAPQQPALTKSVPQDPGQPSYAGGLQPFVSQGQPAPQPQGMPMLQPPPAPPGVSATGPQPQSLQQPQPPNQVTPLTLDASGNLQPAAATAPGAPADPGAMVQGGQGWASPSAGWGTTWMGGKAG